MRFLDMTPYTPFRPMGQSCKTRTIREKAVRWVKPEPRETRDRRFVGRPLALADIEAAVELWRNAYPELYGSSHDFMLYPEDYEARMALVQTWEEDSLKKRGPGNGHRPLRRGLPHDQIRFKSPD